MLHFGIVFNRSRQWKNTVNEMPSLTTCTAISSITTKIIPDNEHVTIFGNSTSWALTYSTWQRWTVKQYVTELGEQRQEHRRCWMRLNADIHGTTSSTTVAAAACEPQWTASPDELRRQCSAVQSLPVTLSATQTRHPGWVGCRTDPEPHWWSASADRRRRRSREVRLE